MPQMLLPSNGFANVKVKQRNELFRNQHYWLSEPDTSSSSSSSTTPCFCWSHNLQIALLALSYNVQHTIIHLLHPPKQLCLIHKMSLPATTGNGDASDAFFHQFSTIICLESHLQGDHSEDVVGPARQHWATKHLAEVAQAQGFPSQLPTQETASNVHAPKPIKPSRARKATSNRSGYTTPWYDNFNLADQGIMNTSGPYRPPAANPHTSRLPNSYRPFDPAELASYRAAVEAQLFSRNTQRVVSAPNGPYYYHGYNNNNNAEPSTSPIHPHYPLPSTPSPRVRYPSTPPNRPARHYRRTPSAESLPDLVGSTTLRANTEPIAESKNMSSLAAPDHYEPIEVYAVEVRNGDFIQSVKNPGNVKNSLAFRF